MSQENVEIVKAAYEAFAREGLDRFMEHFTDDVDYRAVEGAPDDSGPIRGKDAVRAWLQDWIDTFDEFWFEPVELIDAGEDTVVAVERFGGRAKLSGIETDQTEAVVFTIRGGKLGRCREYATRHEALEAAGLEESAMSKENIEIVRGHIEAWSAEEAALALSFLDPHIVLDLTRAGAIEGAVHGPEGVAEHFRRYAGTFEDYRWEVQRLDDLGTGAILAVVTESGRGKGSGVSVERPLAALYTVIDGKIVRITMFPGEREALEAAGLRE
jgi:ketosteroid isomerase-like protein